MAKAKPSHIIFKFILFFGILNTLLFSATPRLDSIEEKNKNLEKIVAEQKLDLKLKDKDIEYLKTNIEKLTSKLDDNLLNLKTYDTKIDGFDKRISDINFYFVFWGALITLIMAFMIFKSKQEARQAIQEWIDKEAEDELKSKIDKHIEHDKKEHIGNLIKNKIENSVSIQIKELKAIIEDLKSTSKESEEELDNIKKIGIEAQDTLQEIQVSKKEIETSEKVPMQKRTDEDYYNLGVESLNNKSYNEAIFNFEQALQHHDKFAKDKIYFALGFAYGNLKEYNKAIDAYQKALDINPQYDKAYYNMGIAYGKLKEYDKAIDAYQKAVEINPQYDKAYYNMGIAYDDLKEYDKAIDAYQKAVEINPQYDVAYNNMGIDYYHLKKFDKVIECLKKAIHINTENSLPYTNFFGLQLIQNEPFDTVLEKKYLKQFSDNKESKIHYDMLKLFENITHGKESGLEVWKYEYKGVNLGLEDWIFDEIRAWIEHIEDVDMKSSLHEALVFFEKRELKRRG